MSRAERTEKITSRVLTALARHQDELRKKGQPQRPFIIGLSGLQGCGKSTLATDLVNDLNMNHDCRSIEISLDDFYLTHAERQDLQVKENALLKVRGQPGTHDCNLARRTLAQFSGNEGGVGKSISLPIFDKSLFAGDGGRLPEMQWRVVDSEPSIQVLVFEGWCIGFQPLSDTEVEAKWRMAANQQAVETKKDNDRGHGIEQDFSTNTLANHRLGDLLYVNSLLTEYCRDFMGPQHFDYFIHLDTSDLVNVYRWRMEQEHMMKKVKGSGMSDSQVVEFVQGYMPAYELYLSRLREGFFNEETQSGVEKEQLHVILDKARVVVDIRNI